MENRYCLHRCSQGLQFLLRGMSVDSGGLWLPRKIWRQKTLELHASIFYIFHILRIVSCRKSGEISSLFCGKRNWSTESIEGNGVLPSLCCCSRQGLCNALSAVALKWLLNHFLVYMILTAIMRSGVQRVFMFSHRYSSYGNKECRKPLLLLHSCF